jgi:hypothetical protein
MRSDALGLSRQPVGFTGWIEDPVFRFHHQRTRPSAPGMPA